MFNSRVQGSVLRWGPLHEGLHGPYLCSVPVPPENTGTMAATVILGSFK
jgi:hypothetical protein